MALTDRAAEMIKFLVGRATPVVSALTVVSGTAIVNPAGADVMAAIPITGGSAGTVKVETGPTSGVANTIVALVAANAVASQVISVYLPKDWFIKVTVATAAIAGDVKLINC